jgi:glycosyltransferase involved in cell wall biosynthesis
MPGGKPSQPLISVITVCFNEVERIKRTCESVVNQTFQDFEWIVLDGGSQDGTVEILRQYQHRMAYFKTGPDGGIYHAMNEGIAKASGQYCIFLNGGDCFHSEESLIQSAAYLKQGGKIFVGGVILVQGVSRRIYHRKRWKKRDLLIWAPPHQAAFFDKDIFTSIGSYSLAYQIHSDFEFFLRAMRHGIALISIPVIVSDFYLGGIGSRDGKKNNEEIHRIRRSYWGPGMHYAVEYILRPLRRAVGKLLRSIRHNPSRWVNGSTFDVQQKKFMI